MTKRALVSVSDKTGVVEFGKGLESLGWEIISTGGTARALREAGVSVKEVKEVTGFPEILGGRVKTLHPKIHGGILARRELDDHRREMEEHGIGAIDLVVVNLYPFSQTVAKEGVTLEEAIENIDIGGPTMVRAAAKNYSNVGVVVNPARYGEVLSEIKERGELSEATRFDLAVEAFVHTAEYDTAISWYLSKQRPGQDFPDSLILPYRKVQDLRYGENPQQSAAFYRETGALPHTVAAARQIQGKELSFNNLNDLNAAWELVKEFTEPTIVAVKHTNPCGVGSAVNLVDAYKKAYDADPVSIFGGIIAANREIDGATAREMSKIFLEVIIAPSFSEEARKILAEKKDIRLLCLPIRETSEGQSLLEYLDFKKVSGGLLVQNVDTYPIDDKEWRLVTEKSPTPQEREDLKFALKVVKHVKSNAIVLAKDGQTVGVGAGQMSRIGAARIAIKQAGPKAKGAVLASDAFFPFKDTVEEAFHAGVKAIVQPGGSLRDQESIDECNRRGMAMLFTGRRYFKH